jgi:hypothetical protein
MNPLTSEWIDKAEKSLDPIAPISYNPSVGAQGLRPHPLSSLTIDP